MSEIVTMDQLKTATGCSRLSDVEKTLRNNGVKFLYGKNVIYTTVDALNAAMGLQSQTPQQPQKFEFLE